MRLLLLLSLVLPVSAASDLSRVPDTELLAHYQKLRTALLDPARAALTENFVLKKDLASFEFKNGNLYFLEPVAERVAGAVFIGDGVLRLKAPSEIERRQLTRFTGSAELAEAFNEAVFLFSDATFEELSRELKFRAEAPPEKAAGLLAQFRKTAREDLTTNFEAQILAGLCFPKHGMFLADLRSQKHGKLLFSIDPREDEPVQLIHYNNALEYFDAWSSFATAANPPGQEFLHASRAAVDASIGKDKMLSAETRTEFTSSLDGPRLMPLSLAASLRVSKARWGAAPGRELKLIQEQKKRDADLWIILPEPLARDTPYTLALAYAGEDVIRSAGQGNFYVGERSRWYPRLTGPGHALTDRTVYHMKFEVPREYTLIATGKLVERHEDKEKKVSVSEWDTELPYPVVGFNYGKFKPKSMKDGETEVTVYANQALGDDLNALKTELELNPKAAQAMGITPGGFNTTGMADKMLAEAINSIRVFTHYFGPAPYKTLAVTQQPSGFYGQSWPTLVFMPYTAFLDSTIQNQLGLREKGTRQFLEEVGSHEIAHQWWGHLVGWNSYHDQWLSEGFAQYSAGLYIHTIEGEKKFKSFLDAQRDAILLRPANGDPAPNSAGPVWLGQRLSTGKSPGAYRLVYAKGAYALHMLRMMLYDYGRRDDSRFVKMMQDFVSAHAHRNASTQDFRKIVEKHYGIDMGWFFDQWIYGSEVPQVTVEYSLTDNEKGVLLKGVIRQSGVSPEFQFLMPLVLKYKAGLGYGKFFAKGAASPFEAQLKQRPESVEFNPLGSVLCQLEVKKN
ncbi:MAG: M1 family metallopeptidase [Acidobacteriota bacterium]